MALSLRWTTAGPVWWVRWMVWGPRHPNAWDGMGVTDGSWFLGSITCLTQTTHETMYRYMPEPVPSTQVLIHTSIHVLEYRPKVLPLVRIFEFSTSWVHLPYLASRFYPACGGGIPSGPNLPYETAGHDQGHGHGPSPSPSQSARVAPPHAKDCISIQPT